ncbi:glycosyltransferase family 39 protein [Candidatus Daviesbacteria bacterium]|nr:glycosyltransferase family 39 protein [Candidatus Daviesbacteria bacterium]
MKPKIWLIGLLFIAALFIRLVPINYPFFSEEETRIAYRGYTLSIFGTDELGRKFPFIFNSSSDYQLPVASYTTALGTAIFGKTDFGARIMFVLIGTLVVFLTYKVAPLFSFGKQYAFFSALIVAFSPVLIFFSKIPNEFIILILLILVLLYLLSRKKINYFFVFGSIFFVLLTSKLAWFILPPFITLTVFSFDLNLSRKQKVKFSIFSLFLSFIMIIVFLQIPQGQRSFLENNFYTLQGGTIKNAIETLRGQGLESRWPNLLEKFLFNKGEYFFVGTMHWLLHLQPSVLFGQFDNSSKYSFISMGAYPKILIIPFILGLVSLIKKSSDIKTRTLFIYPLILTYPLSFIYPLQNPQIVILILPFLSFVCAFGLINLTKPIKSLIVILAILELLINSFNPSFDSKVANSFRPNWIKNIVNEGYVLSKDANVAISDDITSDITPFLQWHTFVGIENAAVGQFPYKFHQTQLQNIKIIGSDDIFYNCGFDKPTFIIASKRDYKEIKRWLNITTDEKLTKVYKDNLEQEVANLLEPTICVRKS